MTPPISPAVVKLCQAEETISSELAKNPSLSPGEVSKKLYGKRVPSGKPTADADYTPASEDDLKLAASCGNWGPTQPGELFLRVYHDVLRCLEADPLGGVVSPPLLGSYGSLPLSVIAPRTDIVRHMTNVLVRASKEVLFATCSWSPSDAVTLFGDSLKELSRRAGIRGERMIVKIIFDKANAKQFVKNHQKCPVSYYASDKIQLPRPEEVPNLDMEVSSLHVPIMGTLHAKFMVVDRKIAIVASNNMEDNANVEMATHLEGPIVDSLYDSFLITWHDAIDPPLPSCNCPARQGGLGSSNDPNDPVDRPQYPTAVDTREQQQIVDEGTDLSHHNPGDPHYDDTLEQQVNRLQSMYSPSEGESRLAAVNRHLNETSKSNAVATGPELEPEDAFTPYITHATEPFPIALVSRRPYGPPVNTDAFVPQNEAFLSCIRNAKSTIFIQTPNLNAHQLLPAITAAVKRGIVITYYVCLGYNDAGEMMPNQGGTNEMFTKKLFNKLSPDERSRLNVYWYTAKDQKRPIHVQFRQRACHIKLLIADGRVGIQGSGNQDTQSWYHSQECNFLIDSEAICTKWREGIDRNQNTEKFGKGSPDDGIWRDENGKVADGSMVPSPPPVSWVKGAYGLAKKVHERGGF